MKFVVIGASAAGSTAIKKLRELNPNDDITLISKDEKIYSRCLLYHLLDDTRTLEELNFAGIDFENNLNINWIKGSIVTSINSKNKQVILNNQTTIAYDKLLVACGSKTHQIPLAGLNEGKNIFGFRNIDDVNNIKISLNSCKNILVIGAGLVGVDVIYGLLAHNKHITLVDMGKHILPLQLDDYSANKYQELFLQNNVDQYYQTGVKELRIDNKGLCYQAVLTNGLIVETDLVINCAGVNPNIDFLKGTGLNCQNGLIVDCYGQTNIKDIYGAGDVTGNSSIWPTAVKEGLIAAYGMSGIKLQIKDYFIHKANMVFFDIPTIAIGQVNGYNQDCREETIIKDDQYCKIIYQNERIIGAIIQGNLNNSAKIADMIRTKNGYIDY